MGMFDQRWRREVKDEIGRMCNGGYAGHRANGRREGAARKGAHRDTALSPNPHALRTPRSRSTQTTGEGTARHHGAKSSCAMFVMPRQCSEPISTVMSVSVWPSARASAPRLWPVTPSPPVTFTTLTGTPRSCSRSAARWRAMRSVPPPAAHGHTSRIGPSGKVFVRLHPIADAINRRRSTDVAAARDEHACGGVREIERR
jgi:hypothetical protein